MAKSLFEEKLNSDKFLVTTEVGPPKGTDISEMVHHIEALKGKVDAINVTDHQSSVMRFPSLGGCLLVQELGGEPILQVTCRDRNRLALQAGEEGRRRGAISPDPRHIRPGQLSPVHAVCFPV